MDEPLARYFAHTEMFMIHPAGDVFTFAELNSKFNTGDVESITRRVNRAQKIFRALQK